MSRQARLIRLALELADGKPVRLARYIDRYGITRRTAIRDVKAIRECGMEVVFRKGHGDFVAPSTDGESGSPSLAHDTLLFGLWSAPVLAVPPLRDVLLETYCALTGLRMSDLPPHRYVDRDGDEPADVRQRIDDGAVPRVVVRSFVTVSRALRSGRLVQFALAVDSTHRYLWRRFEPLHFIVGRPVIEVQGQWIDRAPIEANRVPIDLPRAAVAVDM